MQSVVGRVVYMGKASGEVAASEKYNQVFMARAEEILAVSR